MEKTKEEATLKFNKSEVDFRSKICPVFQTSCKRENCHSFAQGDVIEHTGRRYPPNSKSYEATEYQVRISQCTCAIVTGIMEVLEG